MKNQSRVILISFIVLAFLAGGIAYILSMKGEGNRGGMIVDEISPSTVSYDKEDTNEEMIVIDVTAKNYSFSVDTITLKKGQKVRLNFKSEEGFHDFVIDEFDLKTTTLSSGDSETVEFVADREGEFNFYCSVGNHRRLGMEGKVIVR